MTMVASQRLPKRGFLEPCLVHGDVAWDTHHSWRTARRGLADQIAIAPPVGMEKAVVTPLIRSLAICGGLFRASDNGCTD
jgi:hypothetical protein